LLQSYFADTAFWIALFRSRDQSYLLRSKIRVVTTEAVCWEWLNAMSGIGTRSAVAKGSWLEFTTYFGRDAMPRCAACKAAVAGRAGG